MLQGIHHITYLVWDLNSVEAYFRDHFGVDPDRREDSGPVRAVEYEVGETILRFSQPGRTASIEYELLRRFGGPVISHIGLTVTDLETSVANLRTSGVDFTQSTITSSPHGGYDLIDIAPEESCGMRIQNQLAALNKTFPDARMGIRLQLCENVADAGGGTDA